ncbi:hypothetical protein DND36_25600 [Pseudomonas savastanoi pv. glycinea]|nr:hypothetical protein DND36_25600 [Pseudomonas savastanoi pv. glycinea]
MPNESLNSLQTAGEVKPASIPASVERAMGVRFEFPATAYMSCARVDHEINCLVGVVYQEQRGRFRDGANVRTASLRGRFVSHRYHVFETCNGSSYVVCEWAPDGLSPRFSGVRH